jgi:hypothetical protein
MFVFGGIGEAGRFNDLHELRIEKRQWKRIKSSGVPPSARNGHVCVVVRQKKALLIQGGFDGERRSDFHLFDIDSSTWRELQVSGVPVFRSEHCAQCLKDDSNKVLLFGGNATGYLNELANDVISVDLGAVLCCFRELKIYQIQFLTFILSDKLEASVLVVEGKPPNARRGHASTTCTVKAAVVVSAVNCCYGEKIDSFLLCKTIKDNDANGERNDDNVYQMLISGGFGHQTRMNDLWRLVQFGNTTPFWQRVDLVWKTPLFKPRGFHAYVTCSVETNDRGLPYAYLCTES